MRPGGMSEPDRSPPDEGRVGAPGAGRQTSARGRGGPGGDRDAGVGYGRSVSVVTRNCVRVSGPESARPMVFAHGFGCDQTMWRAVAPDFAADHRVVTFDHVGAGGSDLSAYDSERHGSLRGYAEDLVEVVRDLDLTDVV